MSRFTFMFLFKNGLISIIVSAVIVHSLIYMLQKDINFSEKLPMFLFVLMINTIFFLIIITQEKKLRSNQEKLLAVVKNSNQSILILDRDNNITTLNETGRKMLGIEKDQVVNFCDVCATYPGANKICDVTKCFLKDDKENPVNLYIKNDADGYIPVIANVSYYSTLDNDQGTVVSLQSISKKRNDANKKIEKMITHSIFQAQEKERKLISRELHDGIGQSLYGILLHVELVKSLYRKEEEIDSYLEKLQMVTTQTIEDVRNLSSELRPSTLDNHGLMITLKNFIQELGNRFVIQINFTYKGSSERLPPTIEIALYRIAQEALINATKYSKAERIDVVVEKSQEFVSLSITDYGNGFIFSSDRKGVGIYSMEERASILGGKFSIVSDIGEGTQVKVKIPI